MNRVRIIIVLCLYMTVCGISRGQSFSLFTEEERHDYPSVVYDFLERYLYELDSLTKMGEPIEQRLRDDKVFFTSGDITRASQLTMEHAFTMSYTDDQFYQVAWLDTVGNVFLEMAFPMQYELLLGKPKVQIEKEIKDYLKTFDHYVPVPIDKEQLRMNADSVWETNPKNHYYIESLNTARYYTLNDSMGYSPIYDSSHLWMSAANLFQGAVDSVDCYQLYIEQNLYGYQKVQYRIDLRHWLAYCQSMKLDVYFAVEEEREDGLRALLIAHSQELGFNHMLSLIIPDNFVEKRNAIIKATMNAYIPTQNVKDLYQQYVSKPKKKI